MLILIAILDSTIANRSADVLWELLRQRDVELYSLAKDGRYEELCERGREKGIAEAKALGCFLYAYMLSEAFRLDEAIGMYGIALEGVKGIEAREVKIDVGGEKRKLSKGEVKDVLRVVEAAIYNGLGNAYVSKGDYDRAIEYYNKVLKISLKTLGSEHPHVADVYNNLGLAYSDKGNHDRAIEYYNKALKIHLKTLGPEHPHVADVYNNLGNAYMSKGDYDRAIEYYNKALKIYLKILGPEHPDVADVYNNLGLAYSDKGGLRQGC